MAKTVKGLQSEVKKLKEQIAKARAKAAEKKAKTAAQTAAKPKKPKVKKAKQVYLAGEWSGATPKKLTIYKVRLMLDEQQIGVFGPYATIRAASADAKNILRMHIGPGFKIEEIGVDEPVLRSDGRVKAYFHPSIYSAQATDKGVLTAQVIEQGGEAQRKKTFVKKYNPAGGSRLAVLREDAAKSGYAVETYSPGDGVTRYRFFSLAEMARKGVSAQDQTYFGPLNGVHTALGLAAAKKWLARAPRANRSRRANPRVSFKTRSGKVISFDAKR